MDTAECLKELKTKNTGFFYIYALSQKDAQMPK